MGDSIARHVRRDAAVVAGAALSIALVVVFVVFQSQGFVSTAKDPYSFSELGRQIARGEGFRGEMLGRRAPLYPALLGAIYFVVGEHEIVVKLVQALAHAGTALFAWDMARRIFTRRTALIAGLLCAAHPSLLRYVPDFHLESIFTFLFTLCVWCSVRFYYARTLTWAIGFGVAAGLASLTKAVVMLYPPLFVVLLLVLPRFGRAEPVRRSAAGLLPLLAILAAMALTIAPWTYRNYRVSGQIVPISTGLSDAFLRGFVFARSEFATLQKPPYTDAENEVNAWFNALCAAEGTVWERDPLETERILNRAAKEKLLADPLGVVRKSMVGVFAFWYEMTSLKTSLVAGFLALLGWIGTFLGLGRAHRERRPYFLTLAPILYLNAFLAVLLALGRYSVPVLPCLMVTAAFGIDTIATRFGIAAWPFKGASDGVSA